MELKTPLYDVHVREGGKIVPFAGYLLPVQYPTGVISEHLAVRTAAGLFDVSHMGEIRVEGPGALATLNHILTNDFTKMSLGRVRYSVMCHENGGCVDDLVVMKLGPERYLLVVNAANKDKDYQHVAKNVLPDTEIEDLSAGVAQVALQGPKAPEILAKLVPPERIPEKYYTAVDGAVLNGMTCLISKTGYTGELGYEIYTKRENAEKLWETLREAGKDEGLIPCGLGARDTLRLEAGMPLYGHEMNDEITPLEAGLDFGVKLEKPEFIGREALIEKGTPECIRVGLKVTGRGIVREHEDLYDGENKIGHTTSGTFAPFLNQAVAMARVPRAYSEPGTKLFADVRGRRIEVEVIPLPFYKRA